MGHLVGYLHITYEDLVSMFGKPTYDTPSADNKVRWEWELNIDDNLSCISIYDWKNYDVTDPNEINEWHVGAENKEHYQILLNKIDSHRAKKEINEILQI